MSGRNEQDQTKVTPEAPPSRKALAKRLGRRGIVVAGLTAPTVLTLGIRSASAKTTRTTHSHAP